MRFGRRNRNWAFLRRQSDDPPQQSQSGQVAGDERNALLSGAADEETVEAVDSGEDYAQSTNDAVQDLQSTLGRLYSCVIRAKEGVSAETWPEECMTELVSAVEIAVENEWREVLRALTDSGRILQSYENAGIPEKAIPFLEESHRQLARMAVDLLSGSLRVGAMDQWKAHYQIGLDNLQEHDIRLVSDEEEPRSESSAPPEPASSTAPTLGDDDDDVPFVMPDDTPVARSPVDHSDDLPTLDELPPLGEMNELGREPVHAMAASERDDLPAEHSAQGDDRELPPLEAFGEASYLPAEDVEEEIVDDGDEPDAPQEDPHQRVPKEVENALDTFCAELAALERKRPDERDAAGLYHYVARLTQFANNAGSGAAESMCHAMTVICQLAAEDSSVRDNDRFFELAYGFCGAYVDAYGDDEDAGAATWRDEAEAFAEASMALESDTPTEPAADSEIEDEIEDETEPEPENDADAFEEPSIEDYIASQMTTEDDPDEMGFELEDRSEWPDEPAPSVDTDDDSVELDLMPELDQVTTSAEEFVEPTDPEAESAQPEVVSLTPDENSVESLLDTARRAMSLGAVGDAKLLALRAAAQIAIVEAAKAEEFLQESENRLRESTDAIEAARVAVKQVEASVVEAEQRSQVGEQELQARQRETAEMEGALRQTQDGIADLESQIRALQERRDAEVARAQEQENALEAQRTAQDESKAALEALRQAEDQARVQLEDARQNVKLVQHRRSEAEATVVRARDTLVNQRDSVASLDKTIAHLINRSKRTNEGEEQTLF